MKLRVGEILNLPISLVIESEMLAECYFRLSSSAK